MYLTDGSKSTKVQKVVAGYAADGQKVEFAGAWGDISDPDMMVKESITGLYRATIPVLASIATFKEGGDAPAHPPGLEGGVSMRCSELFSIDKAPNQIEVPYCAWADHSTFGYVVFVKGSLPGNDGEARIADAAARTVTIRNQTPTRA
ncbi:hypothetical protein ABIA39_007791 [Nocardia sp. GAS34]